MSHELREGIELTAIYFNDQQQFYVGHGNCTRIIVVEQQGQLSMVPWALVKSDTGPPQLVNLATVERVALKEAP